VNGAQDLGGQMGFGPVAPEPDEPRFHAEWEKRALAIVIAAGATGSWSIDRSRFMRESLPPAAYLSKSYYDIWISGLERLLVDTGMATPEEIATGKASTPAKPVARVLAAADVPAAMARGAPTERPATRAAAFAPGDAVTARLINPRHHTRLPRYLRGRPGVIERVHGVHVFPDTSAERRGEDPQWLYSVAFRAEDIWGPEAEPMSSLRVDLFEPYLEPRR
jgi:nitrile hydratase